MTRFAVVACIALLSACAPEALEGFSSDIGGGNNGEADSGGNNNGTGGTSNNGETGPSAEFLAIASIMTTNCGAPSCHGAAANNQFLMASSMSAAPDEVFAALTKTATTVDGQQLIVAGDSANSNIYTRMITTDNIKLMPPGASLAQPDLDAVRTWIDAGASFE